MEPNTLYAGLFTLLGLLIGSFLNVVIYRIPRGENIAFPASHCPACGHDLRWYHNVPLFSWLFLRGKCAFCGEKIAIQYPIVELSTALLWLALFLKVGLVWWFPFVAASFTALLALSVIDLKYYAVPDSVNFFALGMALIGPNLLKLDLSNALVNAAIAAGGLWLLAFTISKVARKEAMGGADVIVAGTMAALLGFPNFFVALFLSAILAIVPSLFAKDTMVPFVPFLALATLIVYLFDAQTADLIRWIIYR
jgi:leader peptidase (prepilin peptidase)/N-methyltransferase